MYIDPLYNYRWFISLGLTQWDELAYKLSVVLVKIVS